MAVDQRRIIEAGLAALARIDYAINVVAKFRPPPATKEAPYALINRSEIADASRVIADGQAMAYACLFNSGRRSSSESERLYQLRLARVQEIRKIIGDIDASNLRNRGFRNALAHFDERLLKDIVENPKK